MARVKGALATRKRKKEDFKAGQGLLGFQEPSF